MKILFHHRTASKDGQAVHIEELITAFRRLGHTVVVVGPELPDQEQFGGGSKLVERLKKNLPGFAYEFLEFGYSLQAYRRLNRAYSQEKPDVLYERYNLFMLAGVWLKKREGIPLFLEVNAPLFDERRKYGSLSLTRMARWTEETAWRAADKVLPVTNVLANFIRAVGVGDDRIEIVPNGINLERFGNAADTETAKSNLGLNGHIVLGFTGFVRDWHGLDTVVDLVADAADSGVTLLIVGDGPARQSLESKAAALGVADRVRFTGVIDRDRVADHVAAFDIALQPSVTPYASPLKIFEYLALAKPIVAPRMANIEEILTDEDTALLFAPKGDPSFRTCVDRLVKDAPLRTHLGEAGRRLIDQRTLTWDGNAARLTALFEAAVAAPK